MDNIDTTMQNRSGMRVCSFSGYGSLPGLLPSIKACADCQATRKGKHGCLWTPSPIGWIEALTIVIIRTICNRSNICSKKRLNDSLGTSPKKTGRKDAKRK